MRNENDPRRLASYNIHTSQFLWLARQAGGASSTVRRLVSAAMSAAGEVPPAAPVGPVLTERQGKLLAALAQAGRDMPRHELATSAGYPSAHNILKAIDSLVRLGLVDPKTERVTDLGRELLRG